MSCTVISSVLAEAAVLEPPADFQPTGRRHEREFVEDPQDGANPYLCLYRGQTVWILRRFLRVSVETGRLPSLLGREFFRSKVSWRKAATFEDAVIFVHDVERSLEKLDRHEQELIAKIVLQEHSQGETARLLHSTLRSVSRNYARALDHLSEIFLRGGYLTPFAIEEASRCQEQNDSEISLTCCTDGKNIF